MDWLDPGPAAGCRGCLVACAVLGWFVPALIGRIPEPAVEPAPEPAAAGPGAAGVRALAAGRAQPKELVRRDRLGSPGLAWWTAAWSGLFGAAFGATLGWSGALVYLVPLVPIGVALMVIDWRTTLLPNRIIFPTYALLVVLIPVAALLDRDLHSLYRAGWGWLVIGGWFWVFWFLLQRLGVRRRPPGRRARPRPGLPRLVRDADGPRPDPARRRLGGLVIGIVTRDLRRRVPYGPFMLVGSALSVGDRAVAGAKSRLLTGVVRGRGSPA